MKCDKCGKEMPTKEELQRMSWKDADELEPVPIKDGRMLHRKCAQAEAADLLRTGGG